MAKKSKSDLVRGSKPVTVERIQNALKILSQCHFDTSILEARLRYELTLLNPEEFRVSSSGANPPRIFDDRQDYDLSDRA